MADERMRDDEGLRPERLGRRLRVGGAVALLPELPEVRAGKGWQASEGGGAYLRAFDTAEKADAYVRAVQDAMTAVDPPSGDEDGRYAVILILTSLYLADGDRASAP